MGDKTGIEWTESTWNPVRGCSRVSPGCGGANHQGGCYAEAIAARFSRFGQPFEGFAERTKHGGRWTGKMAVAWNMVDQPIRWRKPRRIFANSMSDLFHKDLPRDDVAIIYGTAIAAVHLRKHTIQILTKRADHMRELLTDEKFWDIANDTAESLVLEHTDPLARRSDDARATCDDYGPNKPPPGIWLGVSVEDQQRADERIPELLETPAALRFLSCEPLLGPVDISQWLARLDWVIAGGESGPNSRPAHPDWFRLLRDQCRAAEVPFFFKQWGEWLPGTQYTESCRQADPEDTNSRFDCMDLDDEGKYVEASSFWADEPSEHATFRVGKKLAGARLDGVEHRAFPS